MIFTRECDPGTSLKHELVTTNQYSQSRLSLSLLDTLRSRHMRVFRLQRLGPRIKAATGVSMSVRRHLKRSHLFLAGLALCLFTATTVATDEEDPGAVLKCVYAAFQRILVG